MTEVSWDLIVIGAGPAGLTSGIYGARSGLKTLVLEKAMPGGCITEASIIKNYPGFPHGIKGQELAKKMMEQCKIEGAEIHSIEDVVDLRLQNDKKLVETTKQTYSCKSVIIATGTEYRRLGIPGEEKFKGRGISYCAVCDGPLFKNQDLLVIGGGNCAAIDAIYLSNLASSVKLIHRRDSLRAEKALVEDMKNNGVDIIFNSVVKEFKGDTQLQRVVVHNNKTDNFFEMEIDGVFIEIGRIPNSVIAKNIGVKLDDKGYIIVDNRQRTNIEGIYAAGDVTKSRQRQIGTAVGNAIVAATEAHGYIKRPYYYNR